MRYAQVRDNIVQNVIDVEEDMVAQFSVGWDQMIPTEVGSRGDRYIPETGEFLRPVQPEPPIEPEPPVEPENPDNPEPA